MPKKNIDNEITKELSYCKELEKRIEKEHSIRSIPGINEN